MEKSKRKNKDKPIRIFRYNRISKVSFVSTILTLILGISAYILNVNYSQWTIFLFLSFLTITFSVFLLNLSETVSIYSDGIAYQLTNKYIFFTWEQLSHFECYYVGRTIEKGIKAHSSVSQDGSNVIEYQIYRKPYDDFIPLSNLLSIPTMSKKNNMLEIDLNQLKLTEFGQLIYDYAPQLFEGKHYET